MLWGIAKGGNVENVLFFTFLSIPSYFSLWLNQVTKPLTQDVVLNMKKLLTLLYLEFPFFTFPI